MYRIIQLNAVSPPQHLRAVNLLVSHSRDVYKSLETLFVCFHGLSVKWQHSIFQTSLWTNLKFYENPSIPKISSSIYLKFLSKWARMYAVFGFGLLRFVCYHHYGIFMLVYCTAMYKLCDCWKKKITKSSFRRNQLCRINCICFFARLQEQIKLESWIHYHVLYGKWNIVSYTNSSKT